MVAGGGEQICVPQIKFLNFSFFFFNDFVSFHSYSQVKWPASLVLSLLRHFSKAVDRFPIAHVKR